MVGSVMLATIAMTTFGQVQQPIDRLALVSRHNPTLSEFNYRMPLQVGNGEFAFGADVTGLQSFVAFGTMSHWGWRMSPEPPGGVKNRMQMFEAGGKMRPYHNDDPEDPASTQWLRMNPHRSGLGQVGMELKLANGKPAAPSDLKAISQTLDLWGGVLTSKFELEGVPVMVKTTCHAERDAIGVQVFSPLIQAKRLRIFLAMPGDDLRYIAPIVGDWLHPETLAQSRATGSNATFISADNPVSHRIRVNWSGEGKWEVGGAPGTKLQVLSARYGTPGADVEVADKLNAKIEGDKLQVRANNELFGDPAEKRYKSLNVDYTDGERVMSTYVSENEMLSLDTKFGSKRQVFVPAEGTDKLEFTCEFSPYDLRSEPLAVEEAFASSRAGWWEYWTTGGVIDLSESTDPRWKELERRVVLSQYLMGANESGSNPPQESGLVNTGWYGRWHTEMIWWHVAHWWLWNREDHADPILDFYKRQLPIAQKLAADQGYKGARWQKCLGPNGVEWPNEIHSFLVWQQPHPIFLAELDYRAHPTKETLEKWADVVEQSAEFMATLPVLNPKTGKYDLDSPLHLVSENGRPFDVRNPAFELSYWKTGLRLATEWQKRRGLTPNPEWKKVGDSMADLPVEEGVYVTYEGIPEMWTRFNFEHPGLIGTYGMLPGDGVDKPTLLRTIRKIKETWNFGHTWGWDFPMLAMCAAKLGEPEMALDFLLTDAAGFQFDEAGLAPGGPYPYFPSNGGLLYAVAMMAAGWDGASEKPAPGFPANGKWRVRSEGLRKAL